MISDPMILTIINKSYCNFIYLLNLKIKIIIRKFVFSFIAIRIWIGNRLQELINSPILIWMGCLELRKELLI
jgi:hypothetical protein